VPAEHYRDSLEWEEQDGYDELIATAGRIERLPLWSPPRKRTWPLARRSWIAVTS
jgi:hypothetical protein